MQNLNISTAQSRAIQIATHIEDKVNYYRVKYDEAQLNDTDSRDSYWRNYRLYRSFTQRAFELVLNLRNPRKFGRKKFSFLIQTPEEYKRRQAERVAKGKEKFERLHTFSPWFLQTNFSSDYGSYECDKCDRVFHHSPSKIFRRANELVYNCACGYCTNEIIKSDHNVEPYR